MSKSFSKIDDIFESSNKAELLEKLSKVLDTEGCKVTVIAGIPNKERNGLDVEVWQVGHTYRYEECGFIQEGFNLVEGYNGDDCEQDEVA